jgi:hypothetical protein
VIGCPHAAWFLLVIGDFNLVGSVQKEVAGVAHKKRSEQPFPASQARTMQAPVYGPMCRITKLASTCS